MGSTVEGTAIVRDNALSSNLVQNFLELAALSLAVVLEVNPQQVGSIGQVDANAGDIALQLVLQPYLFSRM